MATIGSRDRVGFTTSTTGTGNITVGAALTDSAYGDWLTPAQAGIANGEVVALLIVQGNDFEIQPQSTYSTTGPTFTRGTPSVSKIGGTAGTTPLTLVAGAKCYVIMSRSSGMTLGSGGFFKVDDQGSLISPSVLGNIAIYDAVAPIIYMENISGPTNQKLWDMSVETNGDFIIGALDDSFLNRNTAYTISRSANIPANIAFNIPVDLKSYTYATLPTKVAGRAVYCSDCVKPNYGPKDQKTGCVVWTDGVTWYNDEGPVSNPTPATYTGLVATNNRFPDAFAAATVKSIQARTNHIAQDDITSMQVVYVNIAGAAEAAPGATGTLKVGIEYPDGVFQQFLFSGSATGTLPNGTLLISDALTLTAKLTKGSRFRLRPLANCANGVGYTSNIADQYNGEGSTISATVNAVADATVSGTVPASSVALYPVAIIATTSRKTVGIWGDSRVLSGDVNQPGQQYSDQGVMPRAIAQFYAYGAWSYPAETIANFVAGHAVRNALAAYVTHIVDQYGYVDTSLGTTSAAIITNKNTVSGYSNVTGKPYICTTLEPSTTSTDSWTTLANQTIYTGNAQRVIYNNALRTGSGAPTAMSAYFELADQFESARDSGKWKIRYDIKNNAIANGYTTDGVHLSTYGVQKDRDADVVNMSLFSQTSLVGDGVIQQRSISPGGQSITNLDGPATFLGGLGVGVDAPSPTKATAEFRYGPFWSGDNWGCNILLSSTSSHSAIGFGDAFDSSWWAICNESGALTFSKMPAPGAGGNNSHTLILNSDGLTGLFGGVSGSVHGGALPAYHMEVLSAAYILTSTTTAQKLLNATTNGAITVVPGLYGFQCQFALTGMSATSGSFGFALGGTATKTEGWRADAIKAALATPAASQVTWNTTANTTLATAGTATTGHAYIEGHIRVTAGGTIIPQVSLGIAAAATVSANSFFKLIPLSSTSTTTTFGNWS